MSLMKMKPTSIPSSLTQEMKDIINKIDKDNPHKEKADQENLRVSRNVFDFDRSQQGEKEKGEARI